MIRGRCTHQILLISAFTALIMVGVGLTTTATAQESGRLLVYLEVPSHVTTTTRLDLREVHLGRGGIDHHIESLVEALVANELAGTQILLCDGRLPAGFYESLSLDLSSVTTMVGVAEVAPTIPSAGCGMPIQLELVADACAALFLEWDGTSNSIDAHEYCPTMIQVPSKTPPQGALLFVSSHDLDAILAIDRRAPRVTAVVPVGGGSRGLVFLPAQQKLLVALCDSDGLAVINGLSLRLERTIPLPFGDRPTRLVASENSGLIYVLNEGSRSLVGLDAWSLQEKFRLPTGRDPRAIAADDRTGFVYVACEGDDEVQIFDTRNARQAGAYSLLSAPNAVAVGVRSHRLFVGSAYRRQVVMIDLDEGTTGDPQNICGATADFAVSSRSQQLLAAVPDCHSIAVLDPAAGLEYSPLQLGAEPGRIAFAHDQRLLYVVLPTKNQLVVCDPNRGEVTARLNLVPGLDTVVAP